MVTSRFSAVGVPRPRPAWDCQSYQDWRDEVMRIFAPAIRRNVTLSGYQVTSDGLIWSNKTNRFLKPYPAGRGYLMVSLRVNGETIRLYVHRLVAEAFHGPCPDGLDTCHNDGNMLNNTKSNLRYATRSENLADRVFHGTSQEGERNPASTLTDHQVIQIRMRRSSGESLKKLSSHFGVAESTISRIANGVRRSR